MKIKYGNKKVLLALSVAAVTAIAAGAATISKPALEAKAAGSSEAAFYMANGASVSLSEGYGGIRWKTTVNYNYLAMKGYELGVSEVTAGTLIAPVENVMELTVEAAAEADSIIVDIPANVEDLTQQMISDTETNTGIYYSAISYDEILSDLTESGVTENVEALVASAYKIELTARSYVIIDGNVYYAAAEDTTRSARQVANAAVLAKETQGKSDAVQARVNGYVGTATTITDTEVYYDVTKNSEIVTNYDGVAQEIVVGAKRLNATVENGVVKVEAGEIDVLGETYLSFFDNDGVYNLPLVSATMVITKPSDLAYFSIPDSNGQNEGYDETKVFDGYYVLANDLRKCWSSSAWNNENHSHGQHAYFEGQSPFFYDEHVVGLTGTFDGRGHTIHQLWLSGGGLFGMIVGGTVKNVAFVDISFEQESNDAHAVLATYICGGKLENVYIQAANLVPNTSGWHGLVANSITLGTVMNNCIFQLDEDYSERSWGGYGSLMAQTVQKSVFEEEDVSAWGKGCYILSPTVMAKNLIYENGSLSEKDVIDAGNIPDANRQFQAQGQTKTERRYTATGFKRYNNADEMKADAANDYSSYNNRYWDLSSGIPVWKAL
jgi:hypothetical protein